MKKPLTISLTILLLLSFHPLFGQEEKSASEQARDEFNEGIRKGLQEDYPQALEHFLAAIELNPHFAEAHLYCGISMIELGDYPRAIKKISIALEINPGLSDQAYYFRGLAKYGAKDYPGAIHDFSQAIMVNPDHISYFQRGKAHLAQESFGKALQDFEVSLRMKPGFAEGILFRGKALYHVGLLSEALDDLNRAAGKFPENEEVYYYRSLVYRDLENQMAARENLQMAEQIKYSSLEEVDQASTPSGTLLASATNEQGLPGGSILEGMTAAKQVASEATGNKDDYSISPGFYDHNLAQIEPGKGFGVQVASFSASHKLVGLATSYRERYQQPVYIHVSELNNRQLFKIILGDFQERLQVESLRNTLREKEFTDCFIVSYPQLK